MDETVLPYRDTDHFFSAPSLRPDKWVEVLAAARAWQSGKTSAVDRVTELLSDLAPLEAFYAYPGLALLERLRAKLIEGDMKGFYFLAQRISSAIISQDFKHDPAEWESNDEVVDIPADRLPPAFGGRAVFRPYFEVLFVTPHQPSRWQHMISRNSSIATTGGRVYLRAGDRR